MTPCLVRRIIHKKENHMANERKTETIVYNHFKKYESEITIEAQKSDNAAIDNLLKNASKRGNKGGRPEFIISINNNPELLIVVECKADTRKHESKSGEEYADYAVDGAKLYASFLAKEYDVIAIAVSGEYKNNLNISHSLHLKEQKTNTKIFGNELLDIQSYVEGYLKNEEKKRQDYESLIKYSKELNAELQGNKIKEAQRSLLISGIMIALDNKAFRKSYQDHKRPIDLAENLVTTVITQLKNANIEGKKLTNLETAYSFIKSHTILTTEKDVLANLIKDIYNKIHRFVKTYQYYDVLSEFYVEFLRKSNSDKGLGIVLTPNHITELFNLLTGTNQNSIILDNCTGTSGFLISAMSIMIRDCKGNIDKEKNIKEKQLIGIEHQDDIFALACSNMYLHGDGKTNLISGTCFDEKTIEKVKLFKPTIGLLNPPYKANKKKDTEELEFVLNNLECLVEGGKCAAIVPMQCALSVNGKILELKKKLLTYHTLEAVMSMPDELFFNSNVGVVSCIVVITAHKPHPRNKETYFGYWKNDGFVKRKERGRVDAFKRWEGIRAQWIESYMNKKSIAGISIMKNVSANDEWCAEAYMETDYSKLTKELFENTTLQYITYLLGNKQIFKVDVTPKENNDLELNTKNWKLFKISDVELFTIKGSKTVPKLELEEYGIGANPFVTTQATNNGVEGFYNHCTEKGNVLTIDSAVIGYCSYQSLDFSASDHVEKLIPNFPLNKYISMFLTTVINQEQYRYNYGRKAAHIRLNTASIKLPIKNNHPDFEFMETYIKSLPYSSSL